MLTLSGPTIAYGEAIKTFIVLILLVGCMSLINSLQTLLLTARIFIESYTFFICFRIAYIDFCDYINRKESCVEKCLRYYNIESRTKICDLSYYRQTL